MSSPLLLGFDIGGTKSAAVLGDSTGRVLHRESMPTADPEPTFRGLVQAALEFCRAGGHRPVAAGVSCGSPIDRKRLLIQAPPNLPRWIDVPVGNWIRETFGPIAVNIENDADAGALAEWIFGLQRRVNDLVYLTCGTGQGGGLILGGRLHRGVTNLAGEIGHVRLEPDGPWGCHKHGSVEGFTCGRSLALLAVPRLRQPHPPSVLDRFDPEQLTGRDVGEAALAGDALACEVVREVGHHLGRACAILIDVLNPARISLGSLAVRLGELILEPVRAAARKEAMKTSFEACTINAAVLGGRVQDLAALAVAELANGVC